MRARSRLVIIHDGGTELNKIISYQALLLSQKANAADSDLKDIRQATVGVIFFGTPHSGSGEATLAQTASSVAGAIANTNQTVLAALDINFDNGQLEDLRGDFNKMLGDPRERRFWVKSFRELRPMVPHPGGMRLVRFF